MPRKAFVIPSLALILYSSTQAPNIQAAKKPTVPQLTGEQKAIHALNRFILLTDASAAARDAIQTGLDERHQMGATAAGLTLGSPDFQRR